MTREELNKILENHKHWLNADCEGWEKMKADFRNADLRHANLIYADLSHADFRGADLRYANFYKANLDFANFNNTNLSNANLYSADISYADFHYANLKCADLYNTKSNMAHFDNANLEDTVLNKDEVIRKGIILGESMIGWKKCQNNVIVKLEIPKGAIVFSINNNKCRTNRAKVLEITGNKGIAFSKYDSGFWYKVGEEYIISDFNCQYNIECAPGIHFFRTREEAENY